MKLDIDREWLLKAADIEEECGRISAGVACLLPFDRQIAYLKACIGRRHPLRGRVWYWQQGPLVKRPKRPPVRRSKVRSFRGKQMLRWLRSGCSMEFVSKMHYDNRLR